MMLPSFSPQKPTMNTGLALWRRCSAYSAPHLRLLVSTMNLTSTLTLLFTLKVSATCASILSSVRLAHYFASFFIRKRNDYVSSSSLLYGLQSLAIYKNTYNSAKNALQDRSNPELKPFIPIPVLIQNIHILSFSSSRHFALQFSSNL